MRLFRKRQQIAERVRRVRELEREAEARGALAEYDRALAEAAKTSPVAMPALEEEPFCAKHPSAPAPKRWIAGQPRTPDTLCPACQRGEPPEHLTDVRPAFDPAETITVAHPQYPETSDERLHAAHHELKHREAERFLEAAKVPGSFAQKFAHSPAGLALRQGNAISAAEELTRHALERTEDNRDREISKNRETSAQRRAATRRYWARHYKVPMFR